MISPRLLKRAAIGLALLVVLAGCSGSGRSGGKGDAGEYQPVTRDFDLYFFNLRTPDGATGGWKLYRGAHVDAFAFGSDISRSSASVPGPEIRAKEGDRLRITFHIIDNVMAHTIHWHGIHLPWNYDGVPYVSQHPLGERNFGGNGAMVFTYDFVVDEPGTYWYHCHVDTAHHLDMGMYGPLIVEPADAKSDPPFDREATLMLDEWDRSHAHANALAIQYAVSRSGDPRVTANDVYASMRDYLLMNEVYNDTVAGGALGNQPGIRETRNWYPITYAPYFAEYDTYLINGRAFPDTDVITVKTGEILRLRLINAGSQVHAMHLHGHHMFVTHKDGYLVPLLYQLGDASKVRTEAQMRTYAQGMDTILIGPGERYDVYVYAQNPGPWMLHDHIALNEQNDYINPGGMMTMLCYTDNWPGADKCALGHQALHSGGHYASGDLLKTTIGLTGARLPAPQSGTSPSTAWGAATSPGSKVPALPHVGH